MTPRLEREIVDNHREHLERLACWRQRPVYVETEILRGTPAVALVQEVLRHGHDLLVRAHGAGMSGEAPFGAVDLDLLRTCPCPVWLVDPFKSTRPNIVAAVDSSATHPREQALNRHILEHALRLHEARGGLLTVVHAWQTYGEYLLPPRMSPEVFGAVLDRAEHAARDATAALIAEFGEHLARVEMNVVRGHPADVIPAVAFETQADLIVMGSMGRGGLTGLFMGNTAEYVVKHWQGSVFVVKPLGFVSPVVLDPAEERQTVSA